MVLAQAECVSAIDWDPPLGLAKIMGLTVECLWQIGRLKLELMGY